MDTLDLNKDMNEELLNNSEITAETTEIMDEADVESALQMNNLSGEELVLKLKDILAKPLDEQSKIEVEKLKFLFYRNVSKEDAAEQSDVEESKQDEPVVLAFKALLAEYKEKRAHVRNKIEAEKSDNLSRKQAIIAKIKSFVEDAENVHHHVAECRQLQQDWRTIGAVASTHANDLYKTYNVVVETFYDLLKMNNDLRDYDFKKNLEHKTALCESAEKLANDKDVLAAFKQLQLLHDDWKHTGPVAQEHREEIWNRFKEATSILNKKHQVFFEEQKQHEESNYATKLALCEAIEGIDYTSLDSFKAWDAASEMISKIQEEWKLVGYAPRKQNAKIYDRYRKACDVFFGKKSEFYREIKGEFSQNLEKKKALVAQAEALKDSTDWKGAAEKLISIQKEWKTIGPVPKKQSDHVWRQFIAACDHFFQQKENAYVHQKKDEQVNLAAKKELIAKIEGIDTSIPEKAIELLKKLMEEFQSLGHVPFKEKDKIYMQYKTACDSQFKSLKMDSYKLSLEVGTMDKNRMFRERDKLLKQYEHLVAELKTAENNILFFTSNSKKANPLIDEMQQNINALKQQKDDLLKKIQMLEGKLE